MKLSNMAKCISLNRFEVADNEKLLERRATELMEQNEFSAGISLTLLSSRFLSFTYNI